MSSIAIGIGVDYSIHFVAAYRSVRSTGAGPEEAMAATLSTAGRGILYNAAVVVAGFTVLAMSNFMPNRILGYLVSLSVMACLATTLTTLAALVHRSQPAFILRRAGQLSQKR
jgi:predicted RND superfamily exporter protein